MNEWRINESPAGTPQSYQSDQIIGLLCPLTLSL